MSPSGAMATVNGMSISVKTPVEKRTANEPTLILCQAAFAVEMVLEERDVGFRGVLGAEELLVGRLGDCGSLDVLDDALDGRYCRAIILHVNGKVDVGYGSLTRVNTCAGAT